jgi:hypothetical protein
MTKLKTFSPLNSYNGTKIDFYSKIHRKTNLKLFQVIRGTMRLLTLCVVSITGCVQDEKHSWYCEDSCRSDRGSCRNQLLTTHRLSISSIYQVNSPRTHETTGNKKSFVRILPRSIPPWISWNQTLCLLLLWGMSMSIIKTTFPLTFTYIGYCHRFWIGIKMNFIFFTSPWVCLLDVIFLILFLVIILPSFMLMLFPLNSFFG